MKEITYHYTAADGEITIRGFIAYLLGQGENWDIACVEADIKEYYALQYARMDAIEALRREVNYWWECYHDERLHEINEWERFLEEGATYLICQASEVLIPISDADKLTCDMAIYLDKDSHLYKLNDVLCFINKDADGTDEKIIFGFAAQLLTYAACSCVESVLSNPIGRDPLYLITLISNWLDSPSSIYLNDVDFALPNVYALYESFVAEEREKWESENKKRYRSGEPQTRYFMPNLYKRVRAEAEEAIELLTPYLSDKQLVAYKRYLAECQQYIQDHTQTRKKARSESLDQYFRKDIADYRKRMAIRLLKQAVSQKNPAKGLADWVQDMKNKRVLVEHIQPYTRFVAAVNKSCGTEIKADTLSKYFR